MRVDNLGVELDPVAPPAGVLAGCDRLTGAGNHFEAGGQLLNIVAMAHPNLGRGRNPLQDLTLAHHFERGRAVLPLVGGGPNLSPQLVGQQLHAVADAEHRNGQFVDGFVGVRRVLSEHGVRPPGENDSARIAPLNLQGFSVAGKDFTIHAGFSDSPRNQLRILRAKVEDDNGLVNFGHSLCSPGKGAAQITP